MLLKVEQKQNYALLKYYLLRSSVSSNKLLHPPPPPHELYLGNRTVFVEREVVIDL